MPIIVWEQSFSIGNKEIDEQHKRWIAIYNKAHDKMMGGLSDGLGNIAQEAVMDMIEYTKFHFDFEEQFMKNTGYLHTENHKQLHENFVKTLDNIYLDLHHGNHVLNTEVLKLLENWLVYHILQEDKKLQTKVE